MITTVDPNPKSAPEDGSHEEVAYTDIRLSRNGACLFEGIAFGSGCPEFSALGCRIETDASAEFN